MKRLKALICSLLAAAVLIVPAVPASASEDSSTPLVECGTLPDLSKWGWHWPC